MRQLNKKVKRLVSAYNDWREAKRWYASEYRDRKYFKKVARKARRAVDDQVVQEATTPTSKSEETSVYIHEHESPYYSNPCCGCAGEENLDGKDS